MTSELKPCPFCGAKAKFKGGRLSQDSVTIWCENLHRSGGFATKEAAAADWNTRAVPDVPELVTVAKQYRWGGDPKWRTFPPIFKDDTLEVRELVLHSQAAEIIAAKDKEIERLKDDSRITFDKYLDAHNENVTLKAELAQYEAQEPIGYLIGDGHFTMSEKQAEIAKSCTTFTVIPLYASPAPAAELRAENERYKQALEFYANISPISYDFGHTAKTALNPSEPRT